MVTRSLRMSRITGNEVHIAKSAQPPTGEGKPATLAIAPAVANTLSAATDQRFHSQAIKLSA